MGAAPSLEILRQAPFRSLQSGPRQIGLIPITPDFFPSADCPLFRQFYEARNDPSVRYYQRNGTPDAFNLEIIPPIVDSRDVLYQRFMSVAQRLIFPTNAALKATLRAGEDHKVRPISYAIVFLYDGIQYVADGSVRLETPFRTSAGGHGGGGGTAGSMGLPSSYPQSPVYVKVIGGMMDIAPMQMWDVLNPSTFARELTPEVPMNMRMFITKSAGDHNMVRVTLLTAYTYRRQFVDLLGETTLPRLRTTFQSPKTYIPFLCFMRELRDRTAGLFEGPNGPFMWIDDKCLHGDIPQQGTVQAIDAYARYYIEQVEHQAMQRAAKLAAKAGLPPPMPPVALMASSSTMMGLSGQHSGSHADAPGKLAQGPSEGSGCGAMSGTAATMNANGSIVSAFGEPTAREKVNYVLRGYVVSAECDLPAYSFQPHEVYVVCCTAKVRVIDAARVPVWRGPHPLPSPLTPEQLAEKATHGNAWYPDTANKEADAAEAELEGDVLSEFTVHRGDIISFSLSSPTKVLVTPSEAATSTGAAPEKAAPETPRNHDAASDSEVGSGKKEDHDAAASDSPVSQKTGAKDDGKPTASLCWPSPRHGLWQRDPDVFIESVLLSLVKDECKNAREADIDDPRWLHDDVQQCPKHDGVFYIWKFRRGQEVFYYGTVPKFANPNRAGASNSGGGSGNTAAAKSGTANNERKAAAAGNRGAVGTVNGGHPTQRSAHTNANGRLPQPSPPLKPGSAVGAVPSMGAMSAEAMMARMGAPMMMNLNGALPPAPALSGQPQPYHVFTTAPGHGMGGAGSGPSPSSALPSYMFSQLPSTNAAAPAQTGGAASQPTTAGAPRVIYVMPDGTFLPSDPHAPHGTTAAPPQHYDPTPGGTAPTASSMPSFMNSLFQGQPTAPAAQGSQGFASLAGPQIGGTAPIAYGPPRMASHAGSEAGTANSGPQSPVYTATQQLYRAPGTPTPPTLQLPQQQQQPQQPQPQQQQRPSAPQQMPPFFANSGAISGGGGDNGAQALNGLPQYTPAPSTAMTYVLGPNNQLYMTQMPAQMSTQKPMTPPQQPPWQQQQQQIMYQGAPSSFLQQGIYSSASAPQPSAYTMPQPPPQAAQQPMYMVINGQLYQMPTAANSNNNNNNNNTSAAQGMAHEHAPAYTNVQQYAPPQTVNYWR